jgi:PIN domain nuclease of toxin-antitoxin system
LPDTFHADPADRIITATARLNDYTILTADKKILAYPHVNSAW